MPVGLPSGDDAKRMPLPSRARCIASMLFGMGVLRPPSKSRTVLTDTLACLASSSWDQPSQPRAARLCSGANMTGIYKRQRITSRSTNSVDIVDLRVYSVPHWISLRSPREPTFPPFCRCEVAKPSDRRAHVRGGGARHVPAYPLVQDRRLIREQKPLPLGLGQRLAYGAGA